MYLLFDIGGTKMRIAVSKDGKSLENIVDEVTPETFEESLTIFEKYAYSLSDLKIKFVSGAIPGIFNKQKTEIIKCKNLPGWVNKPIHSEIARFFKASVILSNDAKMAGLGEAIYGSGKDCENIAYLTVSTGVGGARIIRKNLLDDDLELEPGHQIIDFDSSIDPDILITNERYSHSVGTLERLVSGKDLSLKYKKPLEKVIDDAVWGKIARYLAVGIVNIVVFWRPEVVIIGGGVGLSDFLKLDRINDYYDEYMTLRIKKPKIKKAALGNYSGLYGTLAYLKNKIIDKKIL